MVEKSTRTGRELEQQVANAYRAIGARKVEHNVEMARQQIDVYVEMETADGALHRIAVEAKDYSKPIGIKIVSMFALVVEQLRNAGLIDEGTIVSRSGFSRPSRNAAKERGVRLLELADLEAMARRNRESAVTEGPDQVVPMPDDQVARTGKELEQQVASAYRAIGARKVEHDVALAGHQIDVYVEMETADRASHRIAVEVKDYAQPVGMRIVREFGDVVDSLRRLGKVDEGIVVSASGFSRQARNAAGEYGLRLLEPPDLAAMMVRREEATLPPVADEKGEKERESPPTVEEPSPEPEVIREWTPPLPAYATDIAGGKDKLGIMPDVRAFSSVFVAEDTDPPLCLGLFGDWGSGKTFFMTKMREEIACLADHARQAEKDGKPTSYHSRIVQIDFNAWHYIDSNLWASLVSHIFDELAKFITEERQEQEKAQLFKELETAKELVKEAEREQEAARANLTGAEEQLKQARKAREDASLELRDLRDYTLEKLFKENGELKTKLETASEQIGLPSAIESAEQLNDTVGELHTLWGLVRTSLRKTPDRQAWFAFAFLVFLAIPLTALGINWVLDKFLDSPQLISNIYFVLTQVATILVSINRWLKPVSGAVSTLEDVRNEFNQRLQKKRRTLTKEEKTKLAQLSVLQEREQVARKALNEAQERFDRAKVAVNELEGIEDGRLLAEFIQERVTSKDYKKHLGIISKVHDDFDALSKLLGGDTEQESDLPRIDRIILYIDDLDRCPEDKVIEVLQAVHLLLAFRLFIVVVGVDSRWLLRSLEEFYPALQTGAAERTVLLDEEVLAWESTPQNYLEKIFQIPFYLRPMSRQGFQKLVASILPPLSEQEEPGPEARPAETIQPVASAEQQDVQPPVPQEGDLQIEPLKPMSVQLGPGEEEVPPPTPPPAEPEEEREVNLTPPALEIREGERKFASSLSALVPTPRAAKRFINIYRLIRSKIPESNLAGFVGSEEEPGEFRAVMILLATLTGFPRQTPYVFNEIHSLAPKLPWRNLVETLKPRRIPETEPKRFRNGVVPNMSAAETNEWIRLYTALRELAPTLPDTMEIYKEWAPEVARFSFRVGKIAESRSLPSDVIINEVVYDRWLDDDVPGEVVQIKNLGDIAEIMTNWTLSDVAQNTYTFPAFTLPPHGRVTVWIKEGTDTVTDLHWGCKVAVWNNEGDTVYLRDANGNLVDTFTWPE